jgi:hypothetical protein
MEMDLRLGNSKGFERSCMSEYATSQKANLESTDVPLIQVTEDPEGNLIADPSTVWVFMGETVTWSGPQLFEVQFNNKSPFAKGKFCAQLVDGAYTVAAIVDKNPIEPEHFSYKLKHECTSGNAEDREQDHDADDNGVIDPIIIVDCATCGPQGGGKGPRKRKQ